jgi:hypothetical protein
MLSKHSIDKNFLKKKLLFNLLYQTLVYLKC